MNEERDRALPEVELLPEPQRRLAPAAKRLWRLTAALAVIPALVAAGWGAAALGAAGAAAVVVALPFVAALGGGALAVALVPGLRYRRWRYEIGEQEIDIRHGALAVRRTLVPVARVQHVETRTGPLQSIFDLATVVFHTAAGENAIPQLLAGEADEVRRRVAALARARTDEL